MQPDGNGAEYSSQPTLAFLPFTFGRPLSCLRRDNCQRWTCFINADTPARTRLSRCACVHAREREEERRERGRHIYSQLVYVFSVIRAVLAAALEHTYLPVAAVLNEFVYSFVLGFYLLFFPSSSLARVPFLHHVDPVGFCYFSPLSRPSSTPCFSLFLSLFLLFVEITSIFPRSERKCEIYYEGSVPL